MRPSATRSRRSLEKRLIPQDIYKGITIGTLIVSLISSLSSWVAYPFQSEQTSADPFAVEHISSHKKLAVIDPFGWKQICSLNSAGSSRLLSIGCTPGAKSYFQSTSIPTWADPYALMESPRSVNPQKLLLVSNRPIRTLTIRSFNGHHPIYDVTFEFG